MDWRSKTLLRLSAKPPPEAPERKSELTRQAAILRRFFHVLEAIETRLKAKGDGGRRR